MVSSSDPLVDQGAADLSAEDGFDAVARNFRAQEDEAGNLGAHLRALVEQIDDAHRRAREPTK